MKKNVINWGLETSSSTKNTILNITKVLWMLYWAFLFFIKQTNQKRSNILSIFLITNPILNRWISLLLYKYTLCTVKERENPIGGVFFPLCHQLVLHTAPWVDGSVGRPLSTPTAQCAPPHFGSLPSLFAASPSQICLFFVAFQCRYQGCHT